ncbi:hypothetical protein PF006_g30289 [Phytophthora fragariae]|uniref:DUF659 domain-containing protein n=1 Tax=Phytophthora fragariae TaxID=53985 RepID=A0A6A3Q0M9_9STRA|nr:hypothetical protein PF006_g30289 [Phytophthora fragariae]
MQKKVVRPPASYFQSSFPPAGSTNLAADMGHPASHERSQFVDLKIDCGSGRSWHFCKHCHRAYNASKLPNGTYSLPEPKRIKGRIENFKSHLKRCEHFIAHGSSTGSSDAATANPTVGGLLCSGDGASTLSQQNPRKQTRIDDYYVGFFEENERQLFERVILEFQADNNLPDTFIERKSTYRLLHLAHTMMIDVSPLPNRKKLGGPVLDRYALACEDDESTALLECQKTTEGRVNFLSDVWQNIARAHLLGCLLWLYGKQLTYGLFQTGSRHDGVAIAAQMERVMIDMQREGWNIGAVVTDNAGQCGRARRLLILRWPHMASFIASLTT